MDGSRVYRQFMTTDWPRHLRHCMLSLWLWQHQSQDGHHSAWWFIGRFDAFRPKGRGFESRSSRHVTGVDLSNPWYKILGCPNFGGDMVKTDKCMGDLGELAPGSPSLRLCATYGPWARPSLAVVCIALRRVTPTKYPCCVGSADE